MKLTTTATFFACALPFAAHAQQQSLGSTMDVYVFPAEGQDTAQQSRDEAECYEWAAGNTGTDPFDLAKQEQADQQQAPMDLNVPEFVVIDTDDKTISTTRSSGLNRSTTFNAVQKEEGLIFLQGVEGGRAFSLVIDEASGRMTAAVSLDGMSVSVFGACTDADL